MVSRAFVTGSGWVGDGSAQPHPPEKQWNDPQNGQKICVNTGGRDAARHSPGSGIKFFLERGRREVHQIWPYLHGLAAQGSMACCVMEPVFMRNDLQVHDALEPAVESGVAQKIDLAIKPVIVAAWTAEIR